MGSNSIRLLAKKSVLLLSKHSHCFRITQVFFPQIGSPWLVWYLRGFSFCFLYYLSEWNQEVVSPASTNICVIMHLLSPQDPALAWVVPALHKIPGMAVCFSNMSIPPSSLCLFCASASFPFASWRSYIIKSLGLCRSFLSDSFYGCWGVVAAHSSFSLVSRFLLW